MKKSHVSFIIAAALAAALLAGCGSSGSSADASGSGKAGGQTRVQEAGSQDGTDSGTKGALSGEITFWHSFTQGPRLETIQKAADKFMEENPDVKINIETFSWNDFYTKWTTGLASGNVPDMSTALPAQVAEMINADALLPVNDLIDGIGRDKFAEAAISEGTVDGNNYSVPLYRHAHVMWIRKDLLEKTVWKSPRPGMSFTTQPRLLQRTASTDCLSHAEPMTSRQPFSLDFYVRSGGGSLLTDDLKANLTSDLAIDGINYWVKVYNDCSPKDSINFDVLDQATLYYQGKTAFDFNSGFQISGVAANSPDLLQYVDCYPVPKIHADDGTEGIMTTNTPMVVWKASKHPEICKAFMKTLYEEDTYVEFLHATPVGMLPAIKGIADTDAYKDDETIKQFAHAEEVLTAAADIGTAFGYEHGPNVQAGIMQNNHVIEEMFQDIITNGTDVRTAAKAAQDKLNALFETAE